MRQAVIPVPAASLGPGVPTPAGFETLGTLGKQAWWRFALAVPLILVLNWSMSYGLWDVTFWFHEPLQDVVIYADDLLYTDGTDWSVVNDSVFLAAFVVLFLYAALGVPSVALAVSALHERGFRTLLTAKAQWDWRGASTSTGLIIAIFMVLTLIELAFFPDRYEVVFNPGLFLKILPLVLLLLPLQVLAEEVFFRGYILQATARFTRNKVVIVTIPALLFAGAHAWNPEVIEGGVWAMLDHIVFSLYATWITVRTNGLEHAFGLHLGNNLYWALFAGWANDGVPVARVFTMPDITQADYEWGLITLIAFLGLHYLVVIRRSTARPEPD